MKWWRIPSIIAGGLNTVLAAIVLSLAVYSVLTDESTNAPIAPKEKWMTLITHQIPFSAAWMVISLVGIYISLSKRQVLCSLIALGLIALSWGSSVYFVIFFEKQIEMKDVMAEELFNATNTEVHSKTTELWIPRWLDNIQKQSKQCCGIVTYRDYIQFWPRTPSRVPKSCCREVNPYDKPCPVDLTQIPFPETVDSFVKVDTGCMDEINEATKRRIEESFHISLATVGILGLGTVAFIVFFIPQYLIRRRKSEASSQQNLEGGDVSDAMVITASSDQLIGSVASTDSTKTVESKSVKKTQAISITDSVSPPLSEAAWYSLPQPEQPPPSEAPSYSSHQSEQLPEPLLPPTPEYPSPKYSTPKVSRTPEYSSHTIRSSAEPKHLQPLTEEREPPISEEQEQPLSKEKLPAEEPPPVEKISFRNEREPSISRRSQASNKSNRENTVFAGLQQKTRRPSEASAGDDNMTIGGANMGRKEVFIAEDSLVGFSAIDPMHSHNTETSGNDELVAATHNEVANDEVVIDDHPQPSVRQPSTKSVEKSEKSRKKKKRK